MQKNKRILIYLLILLAGAGWIGISADRSGGTASGNMTAPQAGFAAPDFTLQTPAGISYTLSESRGQPMMVNLWATWCPPCRAEMPAIERMYREYGERGLVILALNMTYQDDPLEVAPFIEKYDLTFPVLLETTGDVAAAYQLRSLPTSFFIDRQGVITRVIVGGPMSEALLRTYIGEILK